MEEEEAHRRQLLRPGSTVHSETFETGSSVSAGHLAPRGEYCCIITNEPRSDRTDPIFSREQERIQHYEPGIWRWNGHAYLHDRQDACHASIWRLDQCDSVESDFSCRKFDILDSGSLKGLWADSSFREPYSLR